MSASGELLIASGDVVTTLLAAEHLDAAWQAPSALPGMTIGALAAHLVRAYTTTATYLAADEPPAPPGDTIDAAGYFATALAGDADDHASLDRQVLERAVGEAEAGPSGVRERLRDTLAHLATELPRQPATRRVAVLGGIVMLLEDYLATRMVEIAVHSDDLAVSLDIPTPQLLAPLLDLVVTTLVGTAAARHGRLELVRALTRSERTRPGVLPVF